MVSTVASQQEGGEFDSTPFGFLCEGCMFSLSLCGFSFLPQSKNMQLVR